jgi:ribosomal protein S15P/S13E
LSKEIERLFEHLKNTKRSSFKKRTFEMVSKRRKLLKYLQKTDEKLIKKSLKKSALILGPYFVFVKLWNKII